MHRGERRQLRKELSKNRRIGNFSPFAISIDQLCQNSCATSSLFFGVHHNYPNSKIETNIHALLKSMQLNVLARLVIFILIIKVTESRASLNAVIIQ